MRHLGLLIAALGVGTLAVLSGIAAANVEPPFVAWIFTLLTVGIGLEALVLFFIFLCRVGRR